MSGARVQSIEVLKAFRLALCGFTATTGRVLNDADAELQRTLNWLETEQDSYWEGQIRKRSEEVAKAKQAVLVKKLCRNVDGSPGSAVEEEKALRVAMRRLEEAKQKLTGVRQYARRLQKEILTYRGQVQRLNNWAAVDLPVAVSRLEQAIRKLEEYVRLEPGAEPAAAESAGSTDFEAVEKRTSMARPATMGTDEAADESADESPEDKDGRSSPPESKKA